MQDRRESSSTFDNVWSTAEIRAATVPPPPRKHWHLAPRGQRIFNVASTLFILFIAVGWVWSIGNAADEGVRGAPSAARIISRALTDSRSPTMAYLTDAALDMVDPLRGESGKLRATLQQPGGDLPIDTVPHGAAVTFSSGSQAESTTVAAAPSSTGIWSIALALGNAIR